MILNQSLTSSINELRKDNSTYPRRQTTMEELSNAKLNEIFSLVCNKINTEPQYQMRDKGFFTMMDVFEHKCDELQSLLKQMNEYTWDSESGAFEKC